jgi:hypothetical protein
VGFSTRSDATHSMLLSLDIRCSDPRPSGPRQFIDQVLPRHGATGYASYTMGKHPSGTETGNVVVLVSAGIFSLICLGRGFAPRP